ncbi:MAG: dihydroorotase [Bacteroidales bacterium]|nr:dihydroorotase [Bacteroidales bacterium]
MKNYLIIGAQIINEGQRFIGNVLIRNKRIASISTEPIQKLPANTVTIQAKGKLLLPGVIDDQVHFRDPGLTYKGDIYTEARAAVAGGITSFMEMPNTNPQTITNDLLKEKFVMATEKSLANFSFYIGATNDNIQELKKADRKITCGIKVFMGSSTGNMLVDQPSSLSAIFSITDIPIAVHCEDEATIQSNMAKYVDEYGEDIPIELHPKIRSNEACFKSSSLAVNLAKQHNTRLHVIHVSTADELAHFQNDIPSHNKRISSEVCIHHLWFDDSDYARKGTMIKWNPAIKSAKDKDALIEAVNDNRIDVIATDHAPHTLEEKDNPYTKAPSGGPMVQHALVAMLEYVHQGVFSMEKIVDKMCHTPADIFQVKKRGYIRKGYYADLVLVDPDDPWTINKSNLYYKCGWSPMEGTNMKSRVTHTFVNGHLVYDNGIFDETIKGQALEFDR